MIKNSWAIYYSSTIYAWVTCLVIMHNMLHRQETKKYWELTKTCYLKAVDVFRSSGKPYCQLALVSISNGNAIDVVWYYCMSLAVKHPSTVARDNLKSFYSKLKLNSVKSNNDDPSPISLISQFVESFLNMHKTLMFNDSDDRDCFPDIQSTTTQLGQVIREIATRQDEKTNTALHILKTTITRTTQG
ncbi:hypothetical protein RMATCC62417_11709 [Rhizopus microsporus]|nr:hypothetical protein RMATCC62417_11709 [Rhizopus microsporus]